MTLEEKLEAWRREFSPKPMPEPVQNFKATLPAGTYFIGDPCYLLNEESWDELCEVVWGKYPDTFNRESGGLREFRGKPVFVCSTAIGDGCYDATGDTDFQVDVDSGSIGCIPIELQDGFLSFEKDWSQVVFFQPFECTYENGVFKFGHITIDTY